MRVPLAWLRDYVDLPADLDGLVTTFAGLGFPVESVAARPHVSGVVAGTIVKLPTPTGSTYVRSTSADRPT
jgi:hypothetical protein